MGVVYCLLGIVAYLLIGGLFSTLVLDEELEWISVFLWPLVLVLFLVIFIPKAFTAIGKFILDTIRRSLFGNSDETNE